MNLKLILFSTAFLFLFAMPLNHLNSEAGKSLTTVQSKTTTKSISIKLKKKSIWIGPNVAGIYPNTKNWKSSNTKIATISTKGDREGAHKLTAKKKGKTTIRCVINESTGNWEKGDVIKWIVTVK